MRHILREIASEPGDHSEDHGHGILDPLQLFPDEQFRQTVEEITAEYQPLTKASVPADEQLDNQGRLDISEREQKVKSGEPEDTAAKLHSKLQKIGKSTLKPETKVTIAVIGGKLANPEQLNIVAKKSYLPDDEPCSTRVLDFAPGHTQYVVAEVANSKQSKPNIANDINEAVNIHNADVVLIQVGFEKFNLNTLRAVSKAMQKGRLPGRAPIWKCGEEMRRDIQSNPVMRELLRGACSRRGRHTPDRGHGILNPNKLFRKGPEHFKHLVRQIIQVNK
ncbi:uncharacterized protein LOC118403497 [Branchiostoma floridae]|uniref:Uncharacterized protein LOC118403497 n=1 Tax=Branchiostoma floridae TaxID=7739 RepID=A0A9J7KDV8_BRAFL|nr:uncharacterized protein LOC118403497 [Branchiostoma floridae]